MVSTRLVRVLTGIVVIPTLIGIPAATASVALAEPAAPVATVVKDETYPGTADGQIGGFEANVEFSVRTVNADGTLGEPITKKTDIFGVLNGFSAGTYSITRPAHGDEKESAALKVTIGVGEKKEQAAPAQADSKPTSAWGWIRYIIAILAAVATAVAGWLNIGVK